MVIREARPSLILSFEWRSQAVPPRSLRSAWDSPRVGVSARHRLH